MDDDTPTVDADTTNRARRWIMWIAIGVVGVVALGYGAIFFYTEILNDSPDALDEGDLSAAIAETTVPDTADTADTAAATTDAPAPANATPTTAATTEAAVGDDSSADALDGLWTPTEASEFGYRVEEVLAGVNTTAVGRSNEIDGTLVLAGSTADVDVTVQIENISSDDSRRDNQFRGRIMEADQFPEATFVSTEPIEFGTVPVDGEQVVTTATGDLTLKGVTQPVTFEVTAELNGDRIGVLGSIPVLFEDYGIDNPSFGAVTTEDNGLLEFVLVFQPA